MNTIKILFIGLLLYFLPAATLAQDVLLSEKVDTSYQVPKFGLNRLHYAHLYFKFGFIAGQNQQLEDAKFGSNDFGFGLRYKLKMSNYFATGVDLEYTLTNVFYPTQKPILKEKYIFVNLKYDWYLRLNIGKRGDIIGKYMDFGVWASHIFLTNYYTKVEFKNQDYKHLEQTQSSLKYFDKFNYGFFARLGINQWALFVEYRYSDIIKSGFQTKYNNIPPWTIGFQIGLHR